MTPSISLVVPVRNAGKVLPKLSDSLDRQSLPPADWEVVFVDGGSTDSSLTGIEALARYRPNVAVRRGSPGDTWWELIKTGVDTASGDWVMVCDAADSFTRAALERLHTLAAEHPDLEAIVARSVDYARSHVDDRLFGDEEIGRERFVSALLAPAVMCRRDALLGAARHDTTGPLPATQLAVRLVNAGISPRVMTGYPVLIGAGLRCRAATADRVDDVLAALAIADAPESLTAVFAGELGRAGAELPALQTLPDLVDWAHQLRAGLDDGPERCLVELVADRQFELAGELATLLASPTLLPAPAEVSWVDGRIRIRARGSITLPPGPMAALQDAGVDAQRLFASTQPRLGLRNHLTTSIYPVNTATAHTVTPGRTGVTVSVTSELDPRTLNAGRTLPRSAYQVVLEVLGTGWGAMPQAVPRGGVDLAAVLGDTLVSVRDIPNGGLHVDVETHRRSLLGSIDPLGCTVSEDVHGSLLTMPVPDLVVRDAPPQIPGRIVLGSLPLPATLITTGTPRVEGFVSGLPGSVEIRTRIGQSAASPTGCELVTRIDGGFVVRPSKPKTTGGPAPEVDPVARALYSLSARMEAVGKRVEAAETVTRPAPITPTPTISGSLRETMKHIPALRRVVRAGRRALRRAQQRNRGRR